MFLFSSESIKPSFPELEFRKAIKKEYHYDCEMNKVICDGEHLTQTVKKLAKITIDFFLKKVYPIPKGILQKNSNEKEDSTLV